MNDKVKVTPLYPETPPPQQSPQNHGGGGGNGRNSELRELGERLAKLETHFQYIATKEDLSKAIVTISSELTTRVFSRVGGACAIILVLFKIVEKW